MKLRMPEDEMGVPVPPVHWPIPLLLIFPKPIRYVLYTMWVPFGFLLNIVLYFQWAPHQMNR